MSPDTHNIWLLNFSKYYTVWKQGSAYGRSPIGLKDTCMDEKFSWYQSLNTTWEILSPFHREPNVARGWSKTFPILFGAKRSSWPRPFFLLLEIARGARRKIGHNSSLTFYVLKLKLLLYLHPFMSSREKKICSNSFLK